MIVTYHNHLWMKKVYQKFLDIIICSQGGKGRVKGNNYQMINADDIKSIDALFKAGEQGGCISIVQNPSWMRMKRNHYRFSIMGFGFRPQLVKYGSMP